MPMTAKATAPRKGATVKSDRTPSLDIRHIPEPQLEFGFGQKLEYPRDGLYLYGPASSAAPVSEIRYGVIGTAQGVRRFQAWSRMVSGFIGIPEPTARSREIEPQHVPFPGFEQAFGARWSEHPAQKITDIDSTRLGDALKIGNRHEAIKSAVGMYVDRLIAAQRNGPRELDSVVSGIFLGFQAAKSRRAWSKYTASGVRRSSAL